MTCICSVSMSGARYWHLGQHKSGSSSFPTAPGSLTGTWRKDGAAGTVLKPAPGRTPEGVKAERASFIENLWFYSRVFGKQIKLSSSLGTLWGGNEGVPCGKVIYVSQLHLLHVCTETGDDDLVIQRAIFLVQHSCFPGFVTVMPLPNWACRFLPWHDSAGPAAPPFSGSVSRGLLALQGNLLCRSQPGEKEWRDEAS